MVFGKDTRTSYYSFRNNSLELFLRDGTSLSTAPEIRDKKKSINIQESKKRVEGRELYNVEKLQGKLPSWKL